MRIVEKKLELYFIGIYFQLENACSDIIYLGKLILTFKLIYKNVNRDLFNCKL